VFTDRVISELPIMRQTRQDPEMSVFDLPDRVTVFYCIVVLNELRLIQGGWGAITLLDQVVCEEITFREMLALRIQCICESVFINHQQNIVLMFMDPCIIMQIV
jgi:hypothetical protein